MTITLTKKLSDRPKTPAETQAFELNSCIRKIRYKGEPPCTTDMRAYPCEFCGGWHKTRRKLPQDGQ
jgi:hypothetical protein